MAVIPARLQADELRFVLLGLSGEDLKKPFEKEWQTKANYRHDDPKLLDHIEHGGNYGVAGGYGDLHILDSDDMSRWQDMGVLSLIPPTFTIESRPGHRQFYIKCKEHSQSGGLFDPEKTENNDQSKPEYVHIGDIKAASKDGICGGQAVGPGCRHPSGSIYTIVEDRPIAEVSREVLSSIISRFKTSKKVNINFKRLEEDVAKSKRLKYEDKDPIDSLQVVDIMPPEGNVSRSGDELRGDHPVHGSTNGGNYVINVSKNVWHCKRCESGGGPAAAIAVKHGLISCSDAQAGELRGDLFKEVLKIAKEQYLPDGKGKVTDETEHEEISEEIHLKALETLEHGDPIQYIADNCGRMVLGAEKAFKKLICCVAVQEVKQSSGLHPKLNGESGSGKTWVVLTFAHHLPPEAVVKGSSSNLAAFYHQDGNQAFRILDDYQAGNETLDTIIKQTSSVFHQKYDHRTVKKQEPLILHIGSEQTWAITSVDSSQDIQVLNRQIPINVDDSEELTRKVNTRTIERYGKGEEQFPEDETVQVCREIWRILRAYGLINVKIPYYTRIEWLEVSNRRNPSIFMDLLVAHTAMNRYQREKDSDGYYLATEDDFQAAKALFTDKDAEELVKRLTTRERDVIDLLITHSEGLTRDEIASKLNPPVATDRVSQIIRGQKGGGGLMQKVQIAETKISDTARINDDEKRTVHKIVYSLKCYDHFIGFDAVVRLKPTLDDLTKQPKNELSNELSNKTPKPEDSLSKISIEEEESEGTKDTKFDGRDNSLSLKNENNTYFTKAKALDSERAYLGDAKAGLGAKHEEPLKCAVCGADLAGKGRLAMNGTFYCARPGCGYPKRCTSEARP